MLNVGDFTKMLAAGDLKVATGNAGAQDIHVETPVSWTSASRLTLDAFEAVAEVFLWYVTNVGKRGVVCELGQ